MQYQHIRPPYTPNIQHNQIEALHHHRTTTTSTTANISDTNRHIYTTNRINRKVKIETKNMKSKTSLKDYRTSITTKCNGAIKTVQLKYSKGHYPQLLPPQPPTVNTTATQLE